MAVPDPRNGAGSGLVDVFISAFLLSLGSGVPYGDDEDLGTAVAIGASGSHTHPLLRGSFSSNGSITPEIRRGRRHSGRGRGRTPAGQSPAAGRNRCTFVRRARGTGPRPAPDEPGSQDSASFSGGPRARPSDRPRPPRLTEVCHGVTPRDTGALPSGPRGGRRPARAGGGGSRARRGGLARRGGCGACTRRPRAASWGGKRSAGMKLPRLPPRRGRAFVSPRRRLRRGFPDSPPGCDSHIGWSWARARWWRW